MVNKPILKRLNTVDKKNLIFNRGNYNNLGYEVTFDGHASDLLTLPLFIGEEDKNLLDNGGKIRVAYWIESYTDES